MTLDDLVGNADAIARALDGLVAGATVTIGQTQFFELRAATLVDVTTTLAALTRAGNDRRCMRSSRNTSSLYVLAVRMTRCAHDARYDRRLRLADVRTE